MARKQMTPREFEKHMLQKQIEQEVEDAGFSRDLGVPPPTKKEIEKKRKFTDEERGVIYDCLIKNDNSVEDALVDYNKFSAEMETRLKPLTKQTMKSFRMRNMDEYFQHIASDIGLSAIMEIARDGKQEQTRSLAGQYLINRAYGMPTQRNENLNVNVHTWEDVEREREKTLKLVGESGVWENPDDQSQ